MLGPGRSGTSLVMQILQRAGVGLSRTLIFADQSNPEGHWEDRYVVEPHQALLNALGLDDLIGAAVPLPADWMKHPAASVAKDKLKAYLKTTMAQYDGVWAIKDPRLSLLLPLWQELCVELAIPTRYVFCLRHPSAVANSFAIASGLDIAIGEAVWLNRVAVSLSHMSDKFYLMHYEDLIARPAQVSRELLAYIQDSPTTEISSESLLSCNSVVRPELNRATRASPSCNPLTAKLYEELRGLSGVIRVTEKIRAHVNEHLRFCEDFELHTQLRAVTDRHYQLEKPLLKQAEKEKTLRGEIETVQHALARIQSSRAFVLSKYLTEAAGSCIAALKLPYRAWRFLFGPGIYEQSLRDKLDRSNMLLELTRKQATLHSWSLKMILADMLRSNGSLNKDALQSIPKDFPLATAELPSSARSAADGSRKRVLYLGPAGFREGIWDTRAKYIFPDLFDEIHEQAEIYMLTVRVPPFARQSLQALCDRYSITHFELCAPSNAEAMSEVWFSEALELANVIRPDVVTNIFGAVGMGFAIGIIGHLLPCRSVLRFAGDEIGVRRLLGCYDEEPQRLGSALLNQALGTALVDEIITMSPWELKRIQNIVTDRTKAKVCIRGVDLEMFSPKRERNSSGCVRFLYVGRKSPEKGYDLIEHAAELVRERRPAIEFVFAGNFPVETQGNRKYVGFVQSEDLPALYDHADALILPSRAEGFPQAVAEAMAMGKPCILPEEPFGQMFRHEEDVLLTRLDAEALADAVLRLHSNTVLGNRLAQSSLRIARTELDRRRWKGLYRSIILGES